MQELGKKYISGSFFELCCEADLTLHRFQG